MFFVRFMLLGLILSAGIQTARADGYYGTLTGSLVDDVNSDGLVNLGDTLEFSVAVEIEGVGRPELTLEFIIPPEQTFSHIRAYTNQGEITVLSGDLPGDTTLKFDFISPPYSSEATAAVFFRVHIGLDTPPDTTLSVKGAFAYPDHPTGTTTLTTDTNTQSFDIVDEPDVYNGTLTGSLVDDFNNDGLVDLGDILEFSLPIIVTGDGRSDLTLEFHIPPEASFSDIRAYTNVGMPINVLSGDLPGDTTLTFDFEQPPYNMEETAAVFFRVHVGLNTPPDTTLSLQGKFTFPDASTTPSDVVTYSNIVSFAIVGAQALDGVMRATPWLDQGFIGVMEAGESMTYSSVVTNTGYAMSNLVLNGLADAHTRLIPGSVTSNIGTIVQGNAEGDTEVRIALDHFPLGATAAFTYAVTFPASIDNSIKSVTGRALLTDEASEDPYLVLTNETPFGPVVRLVADLGTFSNTIEDAGDPASYLRQESITITNQGPVDVTGVTVRIKGLGYSIRPNEPITCPDVTPRFCREDGTAACADNSACIPKVELQSFVYPGLLKVGETFVIKWQIKIKSEVHEIMTYQLDMTSTTVEAKPRPVELTVRLQRSLSTYELPEAAMSPWAALLALIAAAAYLARKKQQAA